jgi:glycosyltransferase involved in cell wall biosynthesis
MRAADVFLSTSRTEGTGFAVVEATACGTPTIVTDIPAFRAMMGPCETTALFPVGDAIAGAAAVCARLAQPADRDQVRRFFEERLSFGVIGNTLRTSYEALRDGRERRRVCLLVPGGVDRSGVERTIPCVLALVERLAREVDLHVIALRQDDAASTYRLRGATVECVPRDDRLGGLRALLRAHRERPFDVVHALWLHPQGTTAALAAALIRRPVVLHLTGGDLTAIPALPFGALVTARGRGMLRIAVAAAARVTVPSAAFQRRARELGIAAERLTLGVATDRWPAQPPRPRAADEPIRLLSVADINPVKDHTTLLNAFALLLQRGHDVQLDCVGVDTLGGAAQRRAAELGVSQQVRFHGFVPHLEARRFFDAAHILVVSSLHEGDPVAALEAAIAGIAVVGTRVGHLEEWTAACAVTCEPGNAHALADAIETLIVDEPRRLWSAAAAQKQALAHDADAAAQRILQIYEELSGKHDERARLRTAG